MTAYYNEIDPYAAQWLRNLIKAGHIAPGYVDERSIEDVKPDDLREFTQCHFFAGVGVWSYALRQAGWPDDKPIWTGSCPCQPFSTAGKGDGFDDKRHLWPHFHYLIEQLRPPVAFGEQVASKDGLAWFDLVQADLEGAGYAATAVDICSAGVGAPHVRQRLYWVAHAKCEQRETCLSRPKESDHKKNGGSPVKSSGLCLSGKMGVIRKSPEKTNGFWKYADWLECHDGYWRPVEPGAFPLANVTPFRLEQVRAYGNAICAEVAKAFICAYTEVIAGSE
ncbi:C-5 cytosine-specific DNA methylase [Yersinia bercovieri]|uniref:DNA cytosine methyltransferase n=1 Tax=Yersinia bercovieri TaxID=634 RepID=UPI00061BBA87|nr:DNA cytosine methyltransferase [Yersinia bercovieri]CNF54530.1 C-5 cytosine-specific DNA methylase [Yersinia bercovieri]